MRLLTLILLAALVAAACSSGGGSPADDTVAATAQSEAASSAAARDQAAASPDGSPAGPTDDDAAPADDAAHSGKALNDEPLVARADPALVSELRTAAAVTTADAFQFRWRISMAGIPELPDGIAIDGEGAVDPGSQRLRMTMDFGGLVDGLASSGEVDATEVDLLMAFLGADPVEFIVDGGGAYIRWPLFSQLFGVETDWVFLSQFGDAAALPGVDQFVSPTGFLDSFAGIATLSEVGQEDLLGVPTTHYRGDLDLVAAADLAIEQGADFSGLPLDLANAGPLPFDAWVDDAGRVRRLDVAMDSGTFAELPGVASVGMTFEFFAHGEPVTIDLPPSDEVTDISDGLASLIPGDRSTPPIRSSADDYGDDAYLDALWDACANGDADACDRLYFESPFDSQYEVFGDTCGLRFESGHGEFCVDVM